ncbi:MAG: hypothetical protein IJ629_05340 [Clostridia bacterium]|nr:hypothetical protein [Clostridia bacterium]
MEENENVEEVKETVVDEATETTSGNGVGATIKSKKNLIIAIVAILVVICVIFNVFFNTKGKAKSVIKKYCTALGKGKYQKALKQIDPVGMYVFQDLDEDSYEDFWEEYKEFKKSDDYEESMDEWKEMLDACKDAEEDFDKDDAAKIKVKKITKFKKVGKKLYQVKAKIQSKVDGDTDTETMTFYVMKDGLGCKLVGGDAVDGIVMMIAFAAAL